VIGRSGRTIAQVHLWDRFNADLLTRLKPRGAVVLIATLYHEDDLMGRLLRLPRGCDLSLRRRA